MPATDDPRFHQELLLDINADCAQFCPVEWPPATAGAAADDDAANATTSPARDWLAVATYELDEATRTRKGALMVYTMVDEEDEEEEKSGGEEGGRPQQGQQKQQQQQQQRPRRRRRRLALSARAGGLPGVFDAQWVRLPLLLPSAAPDSSDPVPEWGLSLALSDGRFVVLAVAVAAAAAAAEEEEGGGGQGGGALRLSPVAEWQAIRGPEGCEDDANKRMALMIAWDRTAPTARAAVSGSGGTVAVLGDDAERAGRGGGGDSDGDGGSGGGDLGWTEWQAHDLEAWAVAFDPWRPPALYTGSDDASLKLWDLRTVSGVARRSSYSSGSGGGGGGGAAAAPAAAPALLLCDKRTHAAGVTCISPHPWREHILATGSYDERVRLWDARRPRTPLAELDVGGGAWRLQWRPSQGGKGSGGGDLLLAACMYNGFSVLRADGFGGGQEATQLGLEVVERYEAHESIAYGCDWWRGGGGSGVGGGSGAPRCSSSSSSCIVATASFYDKRLHVWSPSSAGAGTSL
jgi:hypothetical protein